MLGDRDLDGLMVRRTDARRVGTVLRRPRYALIAAVLGILAFTVYALLLNYSLLTTFLVEGQYALLISLVPRLVTGYVMTTTNVALVLSTLISAAIGINFAMVAYRLSEMASFGRQGASSLGGMALAVVAPACPACATTIFAFAGLSSTFALLPFKGTEIKVLALLVLLGSTVWIARQIDKDTCRV